MKPFTHFILIGVFILFGKPLSAQSYTIQASDINSQESEYAPCLYKGQLTFVSNKKWDLFMEYKDTDSNPLDNIFIVKKGGVNIFDPTLSSKFNDGPATFSQSGDTIIYTRNQSLNNTHKNIKTPLGLFISTLHNNKWSTPQPLEINNTDFNMAHPFLSPSGDFLLFSSNIPGGFGGADLYISRIENGKFSNPVNLGAGINSSKSEYFPFVDESGKLYFSSDRPDTLGGINIYAVPWEDMSSLVKPTLLAPPLNSNQDDFSLAFTPGKNKGYIASNRSGNDDIYKFQFVPPTFENCEEIHKPEFCYKFKERSTQHPDSIPVKFLWDFGDGETAYGGEIRHCYADTGHYNISLSLEDTVSNTTFSDITRYSLFIPKFNRPYITCADTVQAGQKFTLSAKETDLPEYDILDYFWDFGDTVIRGHDVNFSSSEEGSLYPILGVLAQNKISKIVSKFCAYKEVVVLGSIKPINDSPNAGGNSPVDTIRDNPVKETPIKNRVLTTGKHTNDLFNLFEQLSKQGYVHKTNALEQEISTSEYLVDAQPNTENLAALLYEGLPQDRILKSVDVFFHSNSSSISSFENRQLTKSLKQFDLTECFLIIEGYSDASSAKANNKLLQKRVVAVKKQLRSFDIDKTQLYLLSHQERFAENANQSYESERSGRKVVITIIKK